MKLRSEVSKPKGLAKAGPKPSAEDRTIPPPGVNGKVTCGECGEDCPTEKASVRADGKVECPSCGAPLPGPKSGERTSAPVPDRPGTPPPNVTTNITPEDIAKLPRAFCNECGAEWHRTAASKGRPMPSCGHVDGFVDDPRRAKKYAPPAGLRHEDLGKLPPLKDPAPANDPPAPAAHHVTIAMVPGQATSGEIVVRKPGRRTVVEWGKINFMVAAHSSLGVGPFSVSYETEEGADEMAAFRATLVQLRVMADAAFDEELRWYAEKLGVIEKTFR